MKQMTPTQTRRKTDALLSDTERRITKVYKENSALVRIQKDIMRYMAKVQERTQGEYDAWKNAGDGDDVDALKKAYMDAVRSLTMDSKEYQALMRKFCDALTDANREAINISNSTMRQVYAMNYNEVESDCYDAGIKVVRADAENEI